MRDSRADIAAEPLPILARRREIEDAIARRQVVVVCGETGSGKTTQLPRILFEMGRGRGGPDGAGGGIIAHTQPRRLAARAVAARIAEEMGERLGGLVGVKVRFQDQTGRGTRIKLLTDGMLLAELASDPQLRAYDTIIIDEAHERSLNVDFLLGVLRGLLPKRPELRLVITSATIDPRRFSDHFGGPSAAPVIEVSGRTYPVEVRYRGDGADDDDPEANLAERVADGVEEVCSPRLPEGDVLVFLPGEREIRAAEGALRRRGLDAEILPLLARLTNEEQDRIFHPGPRRRVILATNVAETSLTVPRIRYVVDSGLARISRYDPARKVKTLPVEPISRASAGQRAGRCGRLAAGVCVRLYSEASFAARPAFTEPEIRRTSLAAAILQMKSLGLGAVESFPFLDPPDERAIRDGYETLFELGAIEAARGDAALTPIGTRLARLPVDPRIGRMLLAAEGEGSLREVMVLAAALSVQDPRDRPLARQDRADAAHLVFRHESSDFLTLLNIWSGYQHARGRRDEGRESIASWCREHFLSIVRMREWEDTWRQLRDLGAELGLRENREPAPEDRVHRALLTGLISHVACRTGEAGSFDYRGIRGNTLSIFPGSVLFKKAPKWIMAAEVVQTTKLYARCCARITAEWIEELAGHVFQHHVTDPHLDAETGEPSAWERITMSGVVVVPRRRAALAALDPARAREVFIREALAAGRWTGGIAALERNRAVMREAERAEAKLRRRNIIAPERARADWFETRLPSDVCDPATLRAWVARASPDEIERIAWRVEDVLSEPARTALAGGAFPDSITLGDGPEACECPLEYALAPGTDDDGVTVTARADRLDRLTEERAAWLVPGRLPDVVSAHFKSLPRPVRALVEAKGSLDTIAAECAAVMVFARGPLPDAIAEALEALHGVRTTAESFSSRGLPPHLRLRVRVVDEHGKQLTVDRDLAALHKRFEGRLRRAKQAGARARFEREGVTAWDFGDLPESVPPPEEGATDLFPAVVDRLDSVALELHDSAARAAALTRLGVRRLFALACRDEVEHYFRSAPAWSEMARHFAAFGSARRLADDLSCVVAERVFLLGQPPVRTQREFEARSASQWGRLSAVARETVEVLAPMLDARARVAQRLSGGTPRLWAASVADLREQAAYLFAPGFLRLVPWEHLRECPRYARGMRERLFALREDGSGSESAALAAFAPHWKRFTAWVAAAMSAERAAAEADDAPAPPAGGGAAAAGARAKSAGAPLPQTRRQSPRVNLEAGEWALQPGALPPPVERYRWALEELRLAMFTPALALKPAVDAAAVERLWDAAAAAGHADPPGRRPRTRS